ncbi:MAG TPA: 50S ribosomal protein L18 [Bdellovibrionales bacterium]|nr:MAG: 50S ribosomal protein L18 [Bdellovibrionales bacterium GWB1_52_6]OFZ02613.1 MAG: 50S ribosomal protein L18 [Bdellovibrionales bacterium GWA1_52_35]OFZ41806.1 MAG: 50S ribosomal protein L18 [Bdellovibrionales bacterium GWC1_52_8]HAR43851.1 50S ribosomal protein L18 [Bdellovibrionales bacterium]HCM41470.1 50S ribosomal protein L18 [Bdellovibrionales bacterium]
MATKIRQKTSNKQVVRFKRKLRIRSRVEGNSERPRLSVFRSNQNIYVQLVDDAKGHTLVAASTLEEELKGKVASSIAGAKQLGNLIAKRALAKNISQIVFDRSGYLYHGRIKALADAAREGGLKF